MAKYLDYDGLVEFYTKLKEQIDSKADGGIAVTPSGATASASNGTFTTDELKTLQASDNNYILFNKEIYRLADKAHTTGVWSYTHTGWSGSSIMEKSINITISTRAWTLVVGSDPTTATTAAINTAKSSCNLYTDTKIEEAITATLNTAV